MAQLARSASVAYRAGSILNLSGTAPVLRADRLLQMPGQSPGLYSMLIILKGVGDGLVALLADRARQIGSVPASDLLPVAPGDSFNGCAEAAVSTQDQASGWCALRMVVAFK
jgi:hypothetical protein